MKSARKTQKKAYLIVICDRTTNAILDVDIWSTPEWESSRQLEVPTYVAYQVTANTFQEGINAIRTEMAIPGGRYHYLQKYYYSKI